MAAIKSQHNRSTERNVRLAFARVGIRGWETHPKDVLGHPDFYFPKQRIALFVDGCFWHGCSKCGHIPSTRSRYWRTKIRRNQQRDVTTTRLLRRRGVKVLRIWEHQTLDQRKLDKFVLTNIRAAKIGVMKKALIVDGVAKRVVWWIFERREKLEGLSHSSMAVNPFLAPLLFGFHGFNSFDELATFLLAGHFGVGHSTGFGKLIDEKILPEVFGTAKLDKAFRKQNAPYHLSLFDEIDHLVPEGPSSQNLLSLKASRWTIQLTMAVQLNHVFSKLVALRRKGGVRFDKIVVGVFYGTQAGLTDKYDICRGINRGQKHEVYDLTEVVEVKAGAEFWAWLNGGEQATQEWVMEGVLKGYEMAEAQAHSRGLASSRDLIDRYRTSFVRTYNRYVDPSGTIDWFGILRAING